MRYIDEQSRGAYTYKHPWNRLTKVEQANVRNMMMRSETLDILNIVFNTNLALDAISYALAFLSENARTEYALEINSAITVDDLSVEMKKKMICLSKKSPATFSSYSEDCCWAR